MAPRPLASSETAVAISKPQAVGLFAPALVPRGLERLLRLKGDFGMGLPVIMQDGPDSTLVALVEMLTDDRYSAMTALGTPELVLTRRRAAALGADLPALGETLRLRVPAGAGRDWLMAVAGQEGTPALPGLPIVQAGGPVHEAAIRLAKAAQMVPAVLSVSLGAAPGAQDNAGLSAMTAQDIITTLGEMRGQTRVSSARLPMDASSSGRVHVFRPDDGGVEHYAIEIGTPDLSRPVTVRLHSACFTGDVLGSLKCDCGPQLRAAMAAMAEAGGGVLLYLNQEGRGIGLANKMRAYALQDAGLDTVEANHWLGFEDDQRDFRVGAQVLRRLGVARIRLMTNNPAKVAILSGHGIDVVERVPLRVGRTAQNAHYLATKAAKSGHLL